ncbi:hypothetical protein CEXT_610291 [Caerostris extrusa]|uniref:Uncharacterized protein n=1 Tax=Caerostris extrusa TaxID=172846 RepID=A0AAV4S7V5_CAEEX|nr:hypothetical protein CEXT_610291 [Caerostris extrusa]
MKKEKPQKNKTKGKDDKVKLCRKNGIENYRVKTAVENKSIYTDPNYHTSVGLTSPQPKQKHRRCHFMSHDNIPWILWYSINVLVTPSLIRERGSASLSIVGGGHE